MNRLVSGKLVYFELHSPKSAFFILNQSYSAPLSLALLTQVCMGTREYCRHAGRCATWASHCWSSWKILPPCCGWDLNWPWTPSSAWSSSAYWEPRWPSGPWCWSHWGVAWCSSAFGSSTAQCTRCAASRPGVQCPLLVGSWFNHDCFTAEIHRMCDFVHCIYI